MAQIPASISAKAGFYIQGNEVDFTAAGVKLGASAGVGPVKIDVPVGFQVARTRIRAVSSRASVNGMWEAQAV